MVSQGETAVGVMMSEVADVPAPDGPTIAETSPAGKTAETSLRIVFDCGCESGLRARFDHLSERWLICNAGKSSQRVLEGKKAKQSAPLHRCASSECRARPSSRSPCLSWPRLDERT